MSESYLPVATPTGLIEGDVQCRKCGYNLRGLAVEGRCPECGTPVGYSVQGDLLRFSDPDWLRGLRRGIYLILVGIVVTIVFVVVAIALIRSVGDQSALTPLLTLASQGFIVVGTWMMTESDPSGLGEDDYGAVRRFIRIALLIGLGGTLVQLIAGRMTLSDFASTGFACVQPIAGLLGIAGFCCQLIYLRRLAGRLPDEKLARRARTLAWTIAISYGFVALEAFALQRLTRGGGGGAASAALLPLSCIGGIFGLALVVAFIGYLLLIERFAKRLKVEEASARQTWASATPASPAA